MRHIYTWGQAADVSKKMIQRNLSKGHSLAMCPGGAHEVSYSALVSVVLLLVTGAVAGDCTMVLFSITLSNCAGHLTSPR
jgi:hypothetical protein